MSMIQSWQQIHLTETIKFHQFHITILQVFESEIYSEKRNYYTKTANIL